MMRRMIGGVGLFFILVLIIVWGTSTASAANAVLVEDVELVELNVKQVLCERGELPMIKVGHDPVDPYRFDRGREDRYVTVTPFFVRTRSRSGKVTEGCLPSGYHFVTPKGSTKVARIFECGNPVLNEIYMPAPVVLAPQPEPQPMTVVAPQPQPAIVHQPAPPQPVVVAPPQVASVAVAQSAPPQEEVCVGVGSVATTAGTGILVHGLMTGNAGVAITGGTVAVLGVTDKYLLRPGLNLLAKPFGWKFKSSKPKCKIGGAIIGGAVGLGTGAAAGNGSSGARIVGGLGGGPPPVPGGTGPALPPLIP